MIGGHGETHLLRVVAGYADICNIGFEMSLEEHQAKMEILKRHCDGFGRDPAEIEVTHNTRVAIGETQREFEALAAQAAANTNVSLRAYQRFPIPGHFGDTRALHSALYEFLW